MAPETREATWETTLARLLRLPPAPDAIIGASGPIRVFRAARAYYWYRMLAWFGKQALAAAALLVGLLVIPPPQGNYWGISAAALMPVIELLTVAVFLIQLLPSFLLMHLDYRRRWYLVSERSLRIHEGAWQVREMTMTFGNIQNIAIHQGPVQRLLGIADLEVRSAGGGASAASAHTGKFGNDLHLAYFRGVQCAPAIRDLIRERQRLAGEAGLGDPDDAPTATPRLDTPLEAARALLREVQALRQSAVESCR